MPLDGQRKIKDTGFYFILPTGGITNKSLNFFIDFFLDELFFVVNLC